jgi:hypothetical protein
VGTVRALLVGIDRYAGDVSDLSGCVNDVRAVEEVLPTLVDPAVEYLTRVLLDEEATRQNLVDTFRAHFADAGRGDVALFWYSGHGSQQQTATGSAEPDDVDETLVCHDSRAGSWDLADKELATLVGEVSARGAEVLVVLDCCHSGSGVRAGDDGDAVRQVPMDRRIRPADTLLAPVSVERTATVVAGRRPAYVLLAACAAHQTAKETRVRGVARGAFSAALLDALAETGGRVSYADLIAWTAARIGRIVKAQDPQLEATEPGDADRAFLGDATAAASRSYRLLHDGTGWFIPAGTLHGIPPVHGEEKLLLSVRPGTGDDRREVATAAVTKVEPHRSRVAVDGALDDNGLYRVVVTAWPLPRVRVALSGADDAVAPVRDAVTGSRLAAVADDDPDVEVEATPDGYRIGSPRAGLRIAHTVRGHDAGAVRAVVEGVEQVARWCLLRDLANPRSTITSGSLRIEVDAGPSVDTSGAGPVELVYITDDDGTEQAPQIRVTVRNAGDRRLFVAVLFLDEEHAVDNVLFDAAGEWVPPGGTLRAAGGNPMSVRVPEHLFAGGVTEVTDWIKVIGCTREFDVRELCQGGLPGEAVRSAVTDSPLDRLFNRTVRKIDLAPADPGVDWQTATRVITVERPGPGVVLDRTTDLGNGLTLAVPSGVAGRARVTSLGTAVRDLARPPVPPVLDDPRLSTPLDLVPSRADSDLSVLEIALSAGGGSVDPDHPVQLSLPTPLADDEHVIALVHDGEYWLPVGRVAERGADRTVVAIDSLPAVQASARGLWSSVRVLLRKLVGRPLGLRYEHPVLAVGSVVDGRVRYEAKAATATVAEHPPVLVCVHGIIGDTRGMVEHAATLGGRYGTVLAFDYESINTTIAENARELRRRLVALGFGADRQVDVVAHSMGGLIVRWMVEKEDGAALVRRVVLAGTPHDGSPWPTIQGWATTALGLVLNGLTSVVWPVAVVGALVQAVEGVDDALDELEAGSPVLATLAAAGDPGVPYTLVIGDRALADPHGRAAGLLKRLRVRNLLGAAASVAFLARPNDIAVSVTSAGAVPGPRTPAVETITVACDHLSFFSSEVGRAAIEKGLG